MGSEKKHRIYIRANERKSELYSLFERKNGDLLISKKMNLYSDSPSPGGLRKFKQHRFSVHRSLNSSIPARTVTTTIETSKGPTKSSAYIRCDSLPFLWPVSSHLHSNLDFRAFTMKAKTRDSLTCIGSYQPAICAIVTHLYVGDPGVFQSSLKTLWPSCCLIQFEFFDVMLVACFIPIPSIPKGVSRVVATGQNPFGANAPLSGHGSQPWKSEQLSAEIIEASLELADFFRQRIVFRAFKLGWGASPALKWVNEAYSNVQSSPIEIDCAEASFLRDQIINVPNAPPRSFSPNFTSSALFPDL